MATKVQAERARGRVKRRAPREHAKSVDSARARRARRWRRRRSYQRFLDWEAGRSGGWDAIDGRRLAGCGRWAWDTEVRIRTTVTDDGINAYPEGVQSCGSRWACAPCHAKIGARRSMEVEAGAAAHGVAGGALAMLTLTLRHSRDQSLSLLLDTLKDSWRQLQQHQPWRQLRGDLVGTITATEITTGPNGWHPHLHILLVLRAEVDLVALGDWLAGAWQRMVGRRLEEAPDLAHGVHLQHLDADGAAYVAKIADEVTRADLKGDATNVFGLLDGFDQGDAVSIARWCEYVKATKGRRGVVWSRGLRELLLGDVEELTDEEIAAAEVDGQVVAVIPCDVWARWCVELEDGAPVSVRYLERVEAGAHAPP